MNVRVGSGRRAGRRRWTPQSSGIIVPLAFGAALVSCIHAAEMPAAPSPHAFLERLCDDFGGRLTGTKANAAAMERLAETLRSLGYSPEYSRFSMPGWERGEDRVAMLAPVERPLRVASLSYTQPHPAFDASVVSIGNGRPGDYPPEDMTGRIGLLASGTPLQTREIVEAATARRLRGILFVNREGGGQLLARTGSFTGDPLPLPVYSITQEEGRWMERLLTRGETVRVRMETRSRCREIQTANLVLRVPGKHPGRIVVGAHFDSWDLGQGAMDNGLGIAQLYALALALRGATLHHTVELIWFNGEEQGLRGSRHAVAQLAATPIIAMVNLDMVGVPIAVNALGDESLVPALERWHQSRDDRKLARGVQNINWVASDHTPYQLGGARAITFNAPIPRESVRYYHDLADTIDKLTPKLIDDSSEIITDLVRTLAQDETLQPWRRPPGETERLFTRFGLERRMRAIGLWPFDTIPLVDLAQDASRQVVVDREPGQYLGHPTTVLLEDGNTILCVYPKGHGKGAIQLKRSTNGGRTWSARLPVPPNWSTSLETPTIHRVIDAAGKKRLLLWSGLYPARMSLSEDDGVTWSPLTPAGEWGGIVVMSSLIDVRDARGRYLAWFHDDGLFFQKEARRQTPRVFRLYQTESADGGVTWSLPREIAASSEVLVCEPGVVRSPDGAELALLLREEGRRHPSQVMFSRDEGRTWTAPRALPIPLMGDRHTARYAPDGRLFISFRDTNRLSPTNGDWVGWVGTYQDIVRGREGQYRVRLMQNTRARDCGYPGVEVLPDGTIVATSYGHWARDETPYVVAVRFTLAELDERAAQRRDSRGP